MESDKKLLWSIQNVIREDRRFVRIWLKAVIVKKKNTHTEEINYFLVVRHSVEKCTHVKRMRAQQMEGAYTWHCHSGVGDLGEQ